MANVGNYLGRPPNPYEYTENSLWVLPKCIIGIEVELEGLPSKMFAEFNEAQTYWSVINDGSLRVTAQGNPKEFVLKGNMFGTDALIALDKLNLLISQLKVPPECSERTSLHIHLDARDLEEKELINLLLIYIIVEPILFKYCGSNRNKNIFCLSYEEAQGVVFENLTTDLKAPLAFSDQVYRYSALNLAALHKFGSLEFRHHPGTYDINRIKEWINILMSLKKAAKVMEVNKNTPNLLSQEGALRLVKKIFGKYTPSLMYEGIDSDLIKGIRLSQEVLLKKELVEQQKVFEHSVIRSSPGMRAFAKKNDLNLKGAFAKKRAAIKTNIKYKATTSYVPMNHFVDIVQMADDGPGPIAPERAVNLPQRPVPIQPQREDNEE